jgi:hypothetical protein
MNGIALSQAVVLGIVAGSPSSSQRCPRQLTAPTTCSAARSTTPA